MSNIILGGIALPDGIDLSTGEGHVQWPDRDAVATQVMTAQHTLGGRLTYTQVTVPNGWPITIEIEDHAWIYEEPKDALLALSRAPGPTTLEWYGEDHTVLFDHTAGPAATFDRRQVGRGFSRSYWRGTILLMSAR